MSRIGKAPITIPSGVNVKVEGNLVTVNGPKGTLVQEIEDSVSLEINEGVISLSRVSDSPDHRSKHGLYRALLANMVVGVSEGYKKVLEVIGVGYRAEANGQILTLSVGYSHPIVLQLPNEVKITAETAKGKAPVVTLESIDKQLIGQVAAKIRSFRKPEPYKGKGIRIQGEYIRRKAGKSAGK